MTTDQTDAPVLLDAIERAALAAADADMILREAAQAARDAGVPISAIADAAGGVARSTIYQWTVERGGRVPVDQTVCATPGAHVP